MACHPFYRDTTAPIWYGRLENMSAWNQNIFLYGFITSRRAGEKVNSKFELNYDLHIRAKDNDKEEWKHAFNETDVTVEVECKEGYDLCTWF